MGTVIFLTNAPDADMFPIYKGAEFMEILPDVNVRIVLHVMGLDVFALSVMYPSVTVIIFEVKGPFESIVPFKLIVVVPVHVAVVLPPIYRVEADPATAIVAADKLAPVKLATPPTVSVADDDTLA